MVMRCPSHSAIARSRMFSSSRTLPGKSYCMQRLHGVLFELRPRHLAPAPASLSRMALAIAGNVLAHVAQRRHAQLDHVQPVVQVMAELARLDAVGQVLVRGADDAHVHRVLLGGADLAHLLLLDRAQQLDLHRQRQIGHLVEEQRAAVGGLEEAVAIGSRRR